VEGDRLPITPRFKGNLTGRYTWDVGEYEAYAQGARLPRRAIADDLRDLERGVLGDDFASPVPAPDAYTTLDLSAGCSGAWKLDFFCTNATNEADGAARLRRVQHRDCGAQPYTVSTPPRTFGVRWSRDF
jgi:hypothetical protein